MGAILWMLGSSPSMTTSIIVTPGLVPGVQGSTRRFSAKHLPLSRSAPPPMLKPSVSGHAPTGV